MAADLLDRWREAFAPQVQPFRTDRLDSGASGIGCTMEPSLDVRDTFHVYSDSWTWLEESEFVTLSGRVRRALLHRRAATGRLDQVPEHARDLVDAQRTDSRVVWWPPLLRRVGDHPLVSYVENGLPPSRHCEVTSSMWARASQMLPGAGARAGTFPTASGPNCFGNVLIAAGAQVATSEWVQREPFEEWLAAHTVLVRGRKQDHRPGVVLVWRNHDGLAEHAAVTIGDGYVLNKPSQGWFSPHVMWTVHETIGASRYRGVRLNRYAMTAETGGRRQSGRGSSANGPANH